MTRYTTLALGIVLALSGLSTQAQTYQWKDATGRTIISDTPPPASVKGTRSIGSSQPPAAAEEKTADKDAKAPKTLADRDMEFKKRQQQAKEREEKRAKEEADARAKQEFCQRARRQKATLEAPQRIATVNEQGERQYLDNAQRAEEIERVSKALDDSCQ